MSLRSALFSESKELQACLVSDAAHLTLGTKGEHVARVQAALVRLGVLAAADALAEAENYGNKTAAAVLAYKNAFQIINRRYQNSTDNIVGKMTIASLDHSMWVLDGEGGRPPLPAWPGPHPQFVPSHMHAPARPLPAAGSRLAFAFDAATVAQAATAKVERIASPNDPFEPPLSDLPADMKEVIRRSNAEKKVGVLQMYPFVAGHEPPLSAKELSARFANPDHARAKAIMLEVHARMRPFDIWRHIRTIESVYQGTGAWGLRCFPHDHDVLFNHMVPLTAPPTPFNPALARIPLYTAKFCRDAFNVHGPRDSFREMVKQGPGLHICITQPAQRGIDPCDLHIDEIQQGQVCANGFCVPVVNGQTIGHLKTVGPWLVPDFLKKKPVG